MLPKTTKPTKKPVKPVKPVQGVVPEPPTQPAPQAPKAKPVKTVKAKAAAKPEKALKPKVAVKPVQPVALPHSEPVAKAKIKKFKPLSKGEQIHERRMKQAARQEGLTYHSLLVRRPVKKTGE